MRSSPSYQTDSRRASDAIINANLRDMRILNDTEMPDKKKEDEQEKKKSIGKSNSITMKTENTKLNCIGFDDRKNETETLVQEWKAKSSMLL